MPAFLLAFAGYLVHGIVTMQVPEGASFPGPAFFPSLIAAGLILFAVLLAVSALRARRQGEGARASAAEAEASVGAQAPAEALARTAVAVASGAGSGAAASPGAETGPGADSAAERRPALDWASFAWIVGGFLGFALLLTTLGWVIGGALLFWCVARGFGERRLVATVVVGLALSSLTYIAFDMLLGLSLPSGVLGWGF